VSLASILVLSAPFLLQNSASIQSGAINQRAVSRDCALNVANITGNVTVQNCPGIPAKAIEGLNRELRARRLSEDQARRSAEEWRQKYEALDAALAAAGFTQALLKNASSYLAQGDLTQASKAIDEALRQQDQQVMEAASTHFYRAKVAELGFDYKTEAEQLDAAYRLAPHAPVIATEYGNFLSKYGRLSEADLVFKKLLDESREAKEIPLQAATLINDSTVLRNQGRFPEAQEKLLQAASLWEVCSRKQEPNSLHNEAVAFSGAASVAIVQQHFEEARELIEKAIAISKTNLMREVSSDDQLTLAETLLSSAELYTVVRELDSAFSASEEASRIAKGISELSLASRAKALAGEAKTSECFLTALRHDPDSAQRYCDDALAVLDPMKDLEGGRFKDNLAQALFVSGMVREDRQQWTQALISFNQAEYLWIELIKTGQSQFKIDQAKAAFYSVGAAFNSGDHDAAVEDARRSVLLTEGLPLEFVDFRRQVLTEAAGLLSGLGNQAEAAEIIRKRDQLLSVSKK
jgi:tetratricopeptide (TPR) repeat protein